MRLRRHVPAFHSLIEIGLLIITAAATCTTVMWLVGVRLPRAVAQQPPPPAVDKTIATFTGPLAQFPQVLRLENVLVHDGDTLRADLVLPCGLRLANQTLRGSGWDCHEITQARRAGEFAKFTKADWDREIARGIVARDLLAGLIGVAPGGKSPATPANPTFVVIRNLDAAYGRIEVDVWVDAKSGRVNVREWAWRMNLDRSQKMEE